MNAEFAARLLKAMGEMVNPKKDKTATVVHKGGGKHSYKYTQLDDVLAVIRPALLDQNILLLQGVNEQERLVCSVTDGETTVVLDTRPFRPTGDSQAQGSYETYMRRYQLLTAFGLCGEDDDSDAASNKPTGQRTQQVAQTPWQQLLSAFYSKCEALRYDPGETWGEMIGDLGFDGLNEHSQKQMIDAAMGWVNRMV